MNKRSNGKSWRKAVGILAAAIALSGCGKQTAQTPEKSAASYPLPDPPDVVDCQPGIRGGELIIDAVGDPKTFNPVTAAESSSANICRFLFWSLLNYDVPDQTVEPGLADFWTNSPDGKTWTFKLRKNLRWSDGAPLTADDVVFTWNDVIYNPKINNPLRDLFIVDGKEFTIMKVDELTIKVVTPEVYAPMLENFGWETPIMPKHILEKFVADGTFPSAYGINTDPSQIVGSGPYRLKEYKPAQYTLLERNPYFCEVDKDGARLPYFDDIIVEAVPDENALALRFLSGESDVDEDVTPDQYDEFKAKSASGKFIVLEPGVGLETSQLEFNENTNSNGKTGKPYVNPVKLKWFRNVKFRQACSYAIDRQAIIKSVFSGHAIPGYGVETPGNKKWYDPNIRKYPYDPARALELLKEIGIEKRNGHDFLTDASGNKIEFVLNTNTGNDARKKEAVLIASDLQKLGMNVILQPLEFNTLVTKIDDTHDYDCILLSWFWDMTDPGEKMVVLPSSAYAHPGFPRQKTPSTDWEARIDQLMDAQMQTLDYARRKKDYDEVQEILAEQQPVIFTVTPMVYAAVRPDIGNVRATPLSYFRATWNAEELYFKK